MQIFNYDWYICCCNEIQILTVLVILSHALKRPNSVSRRALSAVRIDQMRQTNQTIFILITSYHICDMTHGYSTLNCIFHCHKSKRRVNCRRACSFTIAVNLTGLILFLILIFNWFKWNCFFFVPFFSSRSICDFDHRKPEATGNNEEKTTCQAGTHLYVQFWHKDCNCNRFNQVNLDFRSEAFHRMIECEGQYCYLLNKCGSAGCLHCAASAAIAMNPLLDASLW